MSAPIRILVVEDSEADYELVLRELRKAGLAPSARRVADAGAFRAALRAGPWDIVLSDYSVPGFGAPEALRILRALAPDTPFVIVSGTVGEDVAVQAMKSGATDYLLKDKLARLGSVVEREVREARARRESRDALRESEARFVQFLENMPHAGVFVLDSEGRPAYANTRAVELLGLGADPSSTPDRLAATYHATVAGSDEPYPVEQMPVVRALRGETSRVDDMEILREGRRMLLEVWGTPIRDSTGRVNFALAVFQDITERRGLESQLRQAQKMEAVGRLAGGVAHDFNNVLTGILGYADLTLRALPPDAPYRADLEEIRKLGERAAGLTRQLLAFSRQRPVELRVLDLNTVVSGTEPMLRRLIGEDVRLSFVLASRAGRVRGDPGQIEQVVMNLVVNARDAMPGGGKLAIETSDVVLEEDYARTHVGARAGPHVLLAVTDTGVGMRPEVLSHLFEPFFTTKEPGKGTGLGLSTVYGIVRQGGGHVGVYSEPGRGSTFKVYLPAAEGPPEGTAPAPPAPVALRGSETVLVVEDETGLRELARRILIEAGYRVLEARDGREALVLAVKEPGLIHLLLTDVVMPEMGGPQLARKLASARPDMRALFVSGYTEHGAEQAGPLEAGALFLPKPFGRDQLLRKVREVLDAPSRPPR
ncbi:MAG: response regulator [Planctomycetales bacterium]|nr:response regulator [Planctomycetales bacterium]